LIIGKILELIICPDLAILFCLDYGNPLVSAGISLASVEEMKVSNGTGLLYVGCARYFGLIRNEIKFDGLEVMR